MRPDSACRTRGMSAFFLPARLGQGRKASLILTSNKPFGDLPRQPKRKPSQPLERSRFRCRSRRRRLKPGDHSAVVHQPRHGRLSPAESLHQTRRQLTESACSRTSRTTRRSTAGHAAGLIPRQVRLPRQSPAWPAIKTLSTMGKRLSALTDAPRCAANIALKAYLNIHIYRARHLTDDNPATVFLSISNACVFAFSTNYSGERKRSKNK
jgi:hypothetical protein